MYFEKDVHRVKGTRKDMSDRDRVGGRIPPGGWIRGDTHIYLQNSTTALTAV